MGSKAAVFIIKLLAKLPFSVLYKISSLLKIIVFDLFGYRKKVIWNNLSKSFPDKSEKEIAAIVSQFQIHLTDVIVETLKCCTISKTELQNRFVFENPELLNLYFEQGRSIVTVLGHYGNWEMAGLAYSATARHKPNLVYRPLSNKAFNNFILSVRTRFGGDLIPETKIFKRMYKEHKEGVVSNTALVGDQTPLRNRGTYIPFLGRPTPFFEGPEQLAARFNYPVIFARVKKRKRGYYTCRFELITEQPNQLPRGEITKIHAAKLQESIVEQPAFWLWSHRRWKYATESFKEQSN